MFFNKKLAQCDDFDKIWKRVITVVEARGRNTKQCKYCKEYNLQKLQCDKFLLELTGEELEYCGNTEWMD